MLLLLVIMTLVACDGRHRKYKTNVEVLREHNMLDAFLEKAKFIPEQYTEITTDTILSNGINIKIQYHSVADKYILGVSQPSHDTTKIYYQNFEAQLKVSKDNTIILNKTIDKSYFFKQEDASFWNAAVMQFVWIDYSATTKNSVQLNTAFCIPDTDICKDFTLTIHENGTIKIREINHSINSI